MITLKRKHKRKEKRSCFYLDPTPQFSAQVISHTYPLFPAQVCFHLHHCCLNPTTLTSKKAIFLILFFFSFSLSQQQQQQHDVSFFSASLSFSDFSSPQIDIRLQHETQNLPLSSHHFSLPIYFFHLSPSPLI